MISGIYDVICGIGYHMSYVMYDVICHIAYTVNGGSVLLESGYVQDTVHPGLVQDSSGLSLLRDWRAIPVRDGSYSCLQFQPVLENRSVRDGSGSK